VRRIALWIALGGAMLAAACSVQPLHGSRGAADGLGDLGAIEIAEVHSRHALEVRNHLIFLLGGGAGQPGAPAYHLDLDVDSRVSETAIVQIGADNEPSAGTVIRGASYRLRDAISSEVIASGRRTASASFDRTRQEFANQRAVRDAENRAARELAEMLRLALAQNLAR